MDAEAYLSRRALIRDVERLLASELAAYMNLRDPGAARHLEMLNNRTDDFIWSENSTSAHVPGLPSDCRPPMTDSVAAVVRSTEELLLGGDEANDTGEDRDGVKRPENTTALEDDHRVADHTLDTITDATPPDPTKDEKNLLDDEVKGDNKSASGVSFAVAPHHSRRNNQPDSRANYSPFMLHNRRPRSRIHMHQRKIFETVMAIQDEENARSADNRSAFLDDDAELKKDDKDETTATKRDNKDDLAHDGLMLRPSMFDNVVNRHAQGSCHALDLFENALETNRPPFFLPKRLKLDIQRHLRPHFERTYFSCYGCCREIVDEPPHPVYLYSCQRCGEKFERNRHLSRDLSGHVALVTGGRTKLGHQCALKLLRAGATVVATTRNKKGAEELFSGYRDFPVFAKRLVIVDCDFDTPNLRGEFETMRDTMMKSHGIHRLDILINCAAQTIRARDKADDVLKKCAENSSTEITAERLPVGSDALTMRMLFGLLFAHIRVSCCLYFASMLGHLRKVLCRFFSLTSKRTTETTTSHVSPGEHDVNEKVLRFNGQEEKMGNNRYGDSKFVSNSCTNSWQMRLADMEQGEMEEVLRINAVAPVLLVQTFMDMLQASAETPFIINVHAREGLLEVHKDDLHLHTNMAKAALHMVTKCLAQCSRQSRVPTEDSAASKNEFLNSRTVLRTDRKKITEAEDAMDTSMSCSSNSGSCAAWNSTGMPVLENNVKLTSKPFSVHGVDPGWISVDEYYEDSRPWVVPPLDEVDGAARILYPVWKKLPSQERTRRHFDHQLLY
ncbi:unnamed protein product [Amoebophrya sp. A25]|nr:unnamed protein product [Amoebophrya sp. A25]|eukprot:GSA25T00013650001.1